MKIKLSFLIFLSIGAALLALNLAYAISFAVSYSRFLSGYSAFRAALHLDLLITLIVFNALYVVSLGVFLLIRQLRNR